MPVYGAIAYSKLTKLYSYSYGCAEPEKASEVALGYCNSSDATILCCQSDSYLALARSKTTRAYGWSYETDAEEAASRAVQECSKYAEDAYLTICFSSLDGLTLSKGEGIQTMLAMPDDNDNNSLNELLQWITNIGISGFGLLPSAEKVVIDYLSTSGSVEEAIDSVIAWRTTYAAGTGFITGLGGIAAMPLTIPASLATSYALGANTAAAVAKLRGYDINSDKVQTMVLICLLGEAGEKILRAAGITIGTKVLKSLINQVPGKVLIEINKKVGFRLITKAGEKGVINLMKLVPVAGGIVGATVDGTFVNTCGKTAKKVFQ